MPTWTDLTNYDFVPGAFASPWECALETLQAVNDPAFQYTHLKLVATGKWEFVPKLTVLCGPDGSDEIPLGDDALIVPSCRPGALIGKVGGSSATFERNAGATAADAAAAGQGPPGPAGAFAIGRMCILPVKDLGVGPLFVGINSRLRPLQVSELKLTISAAKIV